ncbi:DUF3597 domain-containing protein [Devosia lacusdianchii]|uniref:DUF3597 domain-containing protein n=1 Tax=Devosia lacusdianchii TaxID=2917991 RepID=UPI001F05073D|nr:DUF3597 domain-containing protein [Devosia sp. JXJ CY 41]
MGIFDDIKSRIFGAPAASAAVTPASATPSAAAAAANEAAIAIGKAAAAKVAADAAAAKTAAATPASTAPAQPVDVAAVLDAAVAKSGQKLNWKTSIVDLLKALDLDSSLTARKALAAELGYTGDTSDSASMNIWLHKQVIAKLAANGGTLPASMLA